MKSSLGQAEKGDPDAGQTQEFILKDAVTGKTRRVSVAAEKDSLGLADRSPKAPVFCDWPLCPRLFGIVRRTTSIVGLGRHQ